MHELSICQQLIQQVNDIALQNKALSVESITLRIGPLSGIDSALLKQAFPFAAAESIAENSHLIIEESPVVIQCRRCGSKTSTTPNKLVCTNCGDFNTQLLSGDELLLISIDLCRSEFARIESSVEDLSTKTSVTEANHV